MGNTVPKAEFEILQGELIQQRTKMEEETKEKEVAIQDLQNKEREAKELQEQLEELKTTEVNKEAERERILQNLKTVEAEKKIFENEKQAERESILQNLKTVEAEKKILENEKQAERERMLQNLKTVEAEKKILENEKQAERERILQNLKTVEAEKKILEDEKQAAIERRLLEPWRNFERDGGWTSEYHDRLIEQINAHKTYGDVKRARVLLIGPIRSGKSSFINSVASIDKGRIACPMLTGEVEKSMTQKLKQFIPKNMLQNIRLLDTMGVEDMDGEGFHVQDAIYLIDGNVKPDYKFNPRSPIDVNDEKHFTKEPTLTDKVHCVVVVMDSVVIDSDSISEAAKRKMKTIRQHIIEHDIPTIILLTKIDEVCEEVAADITTVYHSRKVRDVVEKAQKLFGALNMHIFPVKNYTKEEESKPNMNILILLALRTMMRFATDRLESIEDQKQFE